MEKEYGGYLPLELSKGRPYYTGEDVIALNAGRYAITYAIEDAGWKKIYLPYWLCDTVKDAIHICLPDVEIGYYHIDDQILQTGSINSGTGEIPIQTPPSPRASVSSQIFSNESPISIGIIEGAGRDSVLYTGMITTGAPAAHPA